MSSRVLDALETPVVLAPLGGGPSTAELAAAVCEAGGLGFLTFAYLSPQEAAACLRAIRELTSRALGVNVFMPVAGPAVPERFSAFADSLAEWALERALPIGTPTFSDDHFDAKLELLLADAPAVISLTFGCPERSIVKRLHAAASKAWITVTTPDEARAAADVGADALVVQGAEAGGHRGGFSDGEQQPVYGLLSLLQLDSAEVDIPLVASGGIAVPVLWLHGLDDPFFTPGMFKDIVEHADDVRFEYLEGCGHFPAEECPEAVSAHLRAFFG